MSRGAGDGELLRLGDLPARDVIDGDAWMNVRIRFEKDGVAYTTDGLTTKIYREVDYVNGEPKAGEVPSA